ncbi:putative quinol monooxygenase [Hymenobacter rigui]|uniref:Antibiotic biosynthesis monooxygenase n=1 Tax=Hymenobacter rigui TaxID=334424 RepID=A0A428KKK2_9BACT|nr:putative quinol monooxygenase [Hymenobacter rigui]RSK46988.1 antibiotic biosynthesis monooxygenase [Hymenobacter rigui]
MLIRIVRMTFRPEQISEFLELFHASEDHIRHMPGCRFLELWQDTNHANVYCTHSHWESEEALNAYRRSALFGQVWPATKALFAAPPLAFSVQPASVSVTNSAGVGS